MSDINRKYPWKEFKPNTCVLHPDHLALNDAAGILVCDECFRAYQDERRKQEGFAQRPFYQELNAARHLRENL